MVGVTGMSLVMPPALVAPAVLLLGIAAGLQLLPRVWKYVGWASLRCLFIGSVAAVPLGVFLLAQMPATPKKKRRQKPAALCAWDGFGVSLG
jgi:uncharacterized protein